MRIENYAFVMGIVVGMMAGFLIGVIYAVQTALAENYTYNLTDQEREEIMLSEVCLNTSIYLEKCEQVVGKITDNSTYGEPQN